MSQTSEARLLWVAPMVTLVGFAASVLLYAVPGALLFFAFAALIVAPVILIVAAVLAFVLAKAYRPAALALIPALALLYFLVAVPRLPLGVAATTARWVQFAFLWHELDHRAATRNLGHEGSLVIITVDGFVPVGSNGFVYDSSGEIIRSPEVRSQLWRSVAARTALGEGCDWGVNRLFGPYYAYSSSC